MDTNDTTVRLEGSKSAAAFALAGLPIGLAVFFVATGGEVREALRECGAIGYIAIILAVVASGFASAMIHMASQGAFRMATLGIFAIIMPFLAASFGVLRGSLAVGAVLGGVGPEDFQRITAAGTAEVMSIRLVGASLTVGLALGTSAALAAMHRYRLEARNERDDAFVAALLLFAVAVFALLVVQDARMIRIGLRAVAGADYGSQGVMLSGTLSDTRGFASTFGLFFAATLAGGIVLSIVTAKRSGLGAMVAGAAWLACLVVGGGELMTSRAGSKLIAQPAPWARVPDFVPAKIGAREAAYSEVRCIAGLERVACNGAGPGAYDERSLAQAIPPAPAPAIVGGTHAVEPETPALEIAIDARMPAEKLRLLLRAAAGLGYRSLTVRGSETPRGFEAGAISPWLRAQAPLRTGATWLLEPALRVARQDFHPAAFDVREGETMQRFAARVDVTPGNEPVLVTPVAPARIVPAQVPPAPGLGLLGAAPDPAVEIGNILGVAPLDVPAPTGRPPLDAATVQRIIRSNSLKIRTCYEQGLLADPELAGRIDVRFSISARGRVTSVDSSGTLRTPSVVACIEAAIKSIAFPASDRDEPMTVTYPFIFSAPR